MLTDEHIRQVSQWASTGAANGAAQLREIHTEDAGIEVRNVGCATLAELPERMPCFEGECVAGVTTRFAGGLCGTALFAMAPEDALAWVRANPDCGDPIDDFVKLGERVQSHLVDAIGSGLGIEMNAEAAQLREDSVPLILLGTHAPSDTAVVCVSVLVAAGEHVVPAHVYMMVEPKLLTTALAA